MSKAMVSKTINLSITANEIFTSDRLVTKIHKNASI